MSTKADSLSRLLGVRLLNDAAQNESTNDGCAEGPKDGAVLRSINRLPSSEAQQPAESPDHADLKQNKLDGISHARFAELPPCFSRHRLGGAAKASGGCGLARNRRVGV